MRHLCNIRLPWIEESAGSTLRRSPVTPRLIAAKVPGKTMRECIARAKTLVNIVNSSNAEVKEEKPLGTKLLPAFTIDLATCSPLDVLLPFYPKIPVATQK